MAKRYVQIPTAYLSGSGVIIGSTNVIVNSFTDVYGNTLSMADFGDKGYCTVEPDTNNEESFTFTTVTLNVNGTTTLGGVSTTLAKSPYTETSGLSRAHVGGSKVVVTDNVAFWNTFPNKFNDETITGLYTFSQNPVGLNPGAISDASTTSIGINRISTSPNVTIGTVTVTIATPAVLTFTAHGLTLSDRIQLTTTGVLPTGLTASTTYYVISTGLTVNTFQISVTQGGTAINTTGTQSGVHTLIKVTPVAVATTDYRIGSNSFGVDSGTANAHVVTLPLTSPTAYVSGQPFSYLVNVTNTTAVTSNIAGLGAKTIKKLNGTTDLVAGDLVAGQLIELAYNATSGFLVLLSPVATVVVTFTPDTAFYGSGIDSDVVISSNTTLTRDMNYNNLTINATFVLTTAGYRVFVKGSLINNGTIRNSGAAGIAGTSGTGFGGAGGVSGTLLGGSSGGTGAAGGGGGGGQVYIAAKIVSIQGIIEAKGGAGANATGAASSVVGFAGTATSLTFIQSGTGGVGGSAGVNAGGAGGIVTSASKASPYSYPIITLGIDGILQLKGGAGGGGGAENGSGFNAGGGGGGMGGIIIFIYNSIVTTGTLSVAGGTGGTPFSTGNAGTSGSNGLSVSIQI